MRVDFRERNRRAESVLPFVYREMNRYFSKHPEARAVRDDVLQDVFEFLLRAADTYQTDGGSTFLTYVYTYVGPTIVESVNRSLRLMPAKRNRNGTGAGRNHPTPAVDYDVEQVPHDFEGPVDLDVPRVRSSVYRALAGVSPENRDIFMRVVVDGEPASAIARERGVTCEAIRHRVGTARRHYNRWVREVREEIKAA